MNLQLNISTLGDLVVQLDGQAVTDFATRKAKALLVYLVVERASVHRRESLFTLLWPGMPEKSARNNLRQTLYYLRKTIPEVGSNCDDALVPLLVSDRDTVQINPAADLQLDLQRMDQLLDEIQSHGHRSLADCQVCIQKLEKAVDLYQGAFLSGFYLDDSSLFEDWAEATRETYRQKTLDTLSSLAKIHLENGEYSQAQETAEKQLKMDALRESAHRQLIEALARSGHRAKALRQYRVCLNVLERELGALPSQETVKLYDQVQAGMIPSKEMVPEAITVEGFANLVPRRHNLPAARTSFIGRVEQIAEIEALLAQHRLVTLTGPGGVGKTRLALQVAEQLMENYANGVWLVELAGLSDPARVPRSVALALNLPEIPGKRTRDALVDFLVRKQLLLILDNCEHLLEACSMLADHLLNACADLTILATSQETLGVHGEAAFRVPTLSLPDLKHSISLSNLNAYDSIRLFVERGQLAAPDFAVTEDNAAIVSQVVRRLDGIPLAIELAASRLRLLSVAQIAQRLDDAFRLLTGGSRSALPRHQTLRASIDWSYNLLSEPEGTLLRRLSVFAGGWRLQAAEQTCADGKDIREEDVLDLLSGLVDKSFVVPVSTASERNRYQMLETVSQYAHELLVVSGESEEMRDRHLGYYLALVEEQAPMIRGPDQIRKLDQFERDLDNLRLAMEWGLQRDIEAQLKISATLMWFWYIRNHQLEGIEWLSRGLDAAEIVSRDLSGANEPKASVSSLVLGQAMVALGYFRWVQFWFTTDIDYAPEQAKSLLEGAISIYRAIGEEDPEIRRSLAWAQVWLGAYMGDIECDPDQARMLIQNSLDVFYTCGDTLGMAECLPLLARDSSDLEEAKRLFQEMLAIHETNQDPHGIGNTRIYIGFADIMNGEYESARLALEAGLVHTRQVNDLVRTVRFLYPLGTVFQYCGDLGRVEEWIMQSLTEAYELGIGDLIVGCLHVKSVLRIAQGRYQQAAEVNQEALRIAKSTGIPPTLATALQTCIRLARLLDDSTQAQKYVESLLNINDVRPNQKAIVSLEVGHLALQNGNLVDASSRFLNLLQTATSSIHCCEFIAPMFDGVAMLALKKGMMLEAARLYGGRWCRGYDHFLSPIEKEQRESNWAAIRAALGKEQFEQVYEGGRMMTYKEAVELAKEIISYDV